MPYIPEYEEEEHYPGKVTGVEFGKAGEKAALTVSVSGEHGVVFKRLFITGAAMEYTEKTLKDIGLTEQQLDNAASLKDVRKFLEGNECSFTVEHREYEGKNHTEIKWLNGPRNMRPRAADPATKGWAIGEFVRLRKGGTAPARPAPLVSAPRPRAVASGPVGGAEPFAPVSDEDVPF